MPDPSKHADEIPTRRGFVLGPAIFFTGQLFPLLVPVIANSNLTTAWKTGLSGLFLLGIPELSIVVAIGVLGKKGFDYLILKIFGFFKKYAPPAQVSARRYRIGLVMFLIPLLAGWFLSYAAHSIPIYHEHRFFVNISGDVMVISSVFILGGDFWDKVRSFLFKWREYNSRQHNNTRPLDTT